MESQSTRESRPPPVLWACLWGLGLSIPIVAVYADVFLRAAHVPAGRDFANLYTAGRLALNGDAWLAFDVNWFRIELHSLTGALTLQNYSYPPHALFVAMLFAWMPYPVAFVAFSLTGLAVFYFSARPLVPFNSVLTVLTPAAGFCLWNGHYGLILGAMWLLFFRYLSRRPTTAGAIAAAMTFKPHMGLFVALAALPRPKVLISAIIGTTVLILASAIAFGPGTWVSFFTATAAEQGDVLTRSSGDFYFRLMPSAYVAYGGAAAGVVAQIIIAGAVLYLLARRPTADPFVLATATFLVVPYVFSYDMTVACVGFAVLIYSDWDKLTWWGKAVLSGAFLSPTINFILPEVVPPVLFGAFLLQLRFLDTRETARGNNAESGTIEAEALFTRQ